MNSSRASVWLAVGSNEFSLSAAGKGSDLGYLIICASQEQGTILLVISA